MSPPSPAAVGTTSLVLLAFTTLFLCFLTLPSAVSESDPNIDLSDGWPILRQAFERPVLPPPQDKKHLTARNGSPFKIALFADLHFGENAWSDWGPRQDVNSVRVMSSVIDREVPGRTARLWSTDGTVLQTFEGHLDRLARIAFHPSSKYFGTTSFDKTWRLWDIESGEELLQEGHSRSVYGIAFHQDGSLVVSSGLDALICVWDLQTGRSIHALEVHFKSVIGINFSPNGYHLASRGEDNTCRIWDLRKKKSLYIIQTHSNLVSQVKFEPQEGYFLVTSSYDMTAKVWSARDFKPVRVLSDHEAKITSMDIVGGKFFPRKAY